MTAVLGDAPRREDVRAASDCLTGHIVRTPVVRSAALDAACGGNLWLKVESLQATGSYKLRGALHAISRIAGDGHRVDGVVAQSTGNHAIAVAVAARRFGLPATLVLPADAPPAKRARIEAAGGRVVLAGTTLEERHAAVERLRAGSDHVVIDAYDHPDVIAGQGSAAWELIRQVGEWGERLQILVVPVGGGGGVAGACLAAQGMGVAVYGVEPVGCDSLRRSIDEGRRVEVPPSDTIAEGLRPSLVGRLPFDICQQRLAGVLTVDEGEIWHALVSALWDAKLLIEPSAAAGLAGAMRLAARYPSANVGVILTGGNVERTIIGRLATGRA